MGTGGDGQEVPPCYRYCIQFACLLTSTLVRCRSLCVRRKAELTLRAVGKLGPFLHSLHLPDLGLKQLPGFLLSLAPALQWLDVRGNKLINLPVELGHHHNIKVKL